VAEMIAVRRQAIPNVPGKAISYSSRSAASERAQDALAEPAESS